MFVRARLSAAKSGRVLYFVQAIDAPTAPCSKEHYMSMLREPSLTVTQRLPGFFVFHIGMRVRLMTSLHPPLLVQDCAGEIVGFDIDSAEHLLKSNGASTPAAEVLLQFMPKAIYVKIDDFAQAVLPPTPCLEHVIVGPDRDCSACCFHCGIVAIAPKSLTWRYAPSTNDGPAERAFYTQVRRTQIPLAVESACSLYSMQGTTADPGLIAHWVVPKRLTADVKWLLVYVMLSRPRALANLRSVGLSDDIRTIIESGPPPDVLRAFQTTFGDKITTTRMAAIAARQHLGWST